MSSKDAHLYHVPQATKKKSGKEIVPSGGLAFSSQLSALISTTKSSQPDRVIAGRVHKKKDDIFSAHNKNSAKRAKRDTETDGGAFHQKVSNTNGPVDREILDRSRRKMEEKARLYAAMKRGDVEDEDGRHMVDFDRKWAEGLEREEDAHRWDNESDSGLSDDDLASSEQVQWTDDFGRTRTGSKAQMAREQRQTLLNQELDERQRPAAPTQIIYGDTVQSAAFNPDTIVAERMADLAAKRDKELTPPPDMHFDSSKEVRSKGVGFMQFSLEADERRKQMENLVQERLQTEEKRTGQDEVMEQRRQKLEERRRLLQEKRAQQTAELDKLQ